MSLRARLLLGPACWPSFGVGGAAAATGDADRSETDDERLRDLVDATEAVLESESLELTRVVLVGGRATAKFWSETSCEERCRLWEDVCCVPGTCCESPARLMREPFPGMETSCEERPRSLWVEGGGRGAFAA
uniref:(northern house mosquito) hypothetical protein n=1 Tax=Culex pipiens TaxID=7175 RepID=A0A8D8NKK4_CULPI